MALAPGTTLGRYEIRSHIGAGGMGDVYLAWDTTLDRPVAIKVLRPEMADLPDRMRRFIQEARAASALNHPNIITIHEIAESGPLATVPFIAIEFVDGETLRQRLQGRPMPLPDVIDVAVQAATALAEAHGAGIIHRDVKPENIMRRRDGLIKVLDFGLAKLIEPGDQLGQQATRAAMTEAGAIFGTALYMSPEQARGATVDARTDIFSLGVVLWEMATGCVPRDSSTLNAGLPPEFERTVSKMLRPDPNERYQTTKELLVDLKRLQQPEPPAASVVRPRTPAVAAALLGAAFLLAAIGSWLLFRTRGSAGIDSIAVLPFENLTRDNAIDYLSDGITESLINSLSQLQGVKVIARNSVFSYKNQSSKAEEIARKLNVRALLTGRVLKQGDTLDVRAELTDAERNAQLWGDHYVRKAVDIFAVQDQIASQVIEALKVRLTGGEREQMAKRQTNDTEAYQQYLQGRYVENLGSEADMQRAIPFFDRAIALDPRYALAYSARGETYLALGDLTLPMKEAMPKARENAARALALDDKLVDAAVLSANIKFSYDWDFAGAEADFRQAIAQNPNHAEARHQFTYLLGLTGRADEAVAEIDRAAQLDPVNPSIVVDTQLPSMLGRHLKDALGRGQRALGLFPNFFLAHMALGSTLVMKGETAAGVAELEKARALEANPLVLGNLGYAYARDGRVDAARKVLEELNAASRARYVQAFAVAAIHAGLNEKDEAFEWLEKAYEERSFWLVWLNADYRMDGLRADPRFAALVRRVGLP